MTKWTKTQLGWEEDISWRNKAFGLLMQVCFGETEEQRKEALKQHQEMMDIEIEEAKREYRTD